MIVGLTGGICSGKTEAASVLTGLGLRVLDADVISRFLTAYDPKVLARIEQRFGTAMFHPLGALDRQRLAQVIFSNDVERGALEAILHPPILKLQRDNIDAAQAAGRHLVISAPLLIEPGAYREMDRVVLISCPVSLQVSRLAQRSKHSAEEAQQRIAAQMPLATKQKFADVVIDNDGTLAGFQVKVRDAFLSLLEQDTNA
jgi:dephospho-CoA kinase